MDILRLTIDRPGTLNALDARTMDDLATEIRGSGAEADVVVIQATGDAFSSGGDLKAMAGTNLAPRDIMQSLSGLIHAIRDCPRPVAARVQGDAHGAGAMLAFQCDAALARASAKFTLPFLHVGLIPDAGATWLLRRLGHQRALHLAWTGAPFTAEQAADWGLILGSVEDDFTQAFDDLVRSLAHLPPHAAAATKRAIRDDAGLDGALRREARLQAIALGGAEHHAGVQAFLAKQAPPWTPSD